jgi:hypothetical protein
VNISKNLLVDKQFALEVKMKIKILRILQNVKFPPHYVCIFSLCYFILIDNKYILIKLMYIFLILLFLYFEAKRIILYIKHSGRIAISFSLLIAYAVMVLIIYHIINIRISSNNYGKVLESTMNIIIPFSVANITALFILLQQNYQKFRSTYLIKHLLKSPLLWIATFIPTGILFFNAYILNNVKQYDFLPTLLLFFSFLSTLFFVFYFRIILETTRMLRKLMVAANQADFEAYKENIIHTNESIIDAILRIIQSMIETNDIPRIHSAFYSVGYWVNRNIDNIKIGNKLFYSQITSRFISFFTTINHEIILSGNIIIHNYYINSIRHMIIPSINVGNYLDYRIIFFSLKNYLLKRLERKEEEFARDVYNLIYSCCSVILLNLQERKNIPGHQNSDLLDFKQTFLGRNINDIINTAIKNGCIDFLRRMHIFEDLFVLSREDDFDYRERWNDKVKDIYIETRFIVFQKNKYLLENGKHISDFEDDFGLFLKHRINSEKNEVYICYNELIKYVLNEMLSIYENALSLNIKFNESDFQLLWSECFSAIDHNDHATFTLFFSFFLYIFDKICAREYEKPEPDNNMIYWIFARILQIRELEGNNDFKDEIERKINRLKEKHEKISELETIKLEFKKISDENYNELFQI